MFPRTIKVFNIYWLKPKYKAFKELQFKYILLNKIFKTILSTVFWNIQMKGNLYHFPLLTKTKIMYNLLHLLFFSIEIFLFYWINRSILLMISNVTNEICSDCRLDSSLFKPRCTNWSPIYLHKHTQATLTWCCLLSRMHFYGSLITSGCYHASQGNGGMLLWTKEQPRAGRLKQSSSPLQTTLGLLNICCSC